jgi:Glycosyltransferase
LIGRVVPIKDVKTFLHAVSDTKRTIPGLRAWIVGPVDEDPLYYNECYSLMKSLNLEETVSFKGKMNMEDVLSEVDVVALTSISEAQPLTLLEAGAAKIPVVATNVGACSDIILGEEGETPPIGPGGVVTPLADPASIAQALIQLLLNPHFYRECAENLQTRVLRYYRKDQQKMAYEALYQKYVGA